MQDIGSLFATLVLFAAALAYVAACGRMKAGAHHD